MLTTFIASAMLAGSGGPSTPPTRTSWDPERVICKYDLEPGSRLARRKVCMTASQWKEWQLTERLNLLRRQYNGAP